MIDGSNNSRGNISLGVEKTDDELMSAIRFRTTPKGDLTHYLFIFNNTESLGAELNKSAYYRLVTMLYLDIQKWEE